MPVALTAAAGAVIAGRLSRAGVGFNNVEDVVFEGELDVHEAVNADAVGESDGGGADFVDVFGAEGHGWEGRRRSRRSGCRLLRCVP